MGAVSYWARRSIEREEEWNTKSRETIEKELASQYERTAQAIQAKIEQLYGKFASDNGVSMTEARRLIQGSEYRTWKKDIEEYLKEYKATGNPKTLLELNTLAMRSRISRLDKLYGDTLIELDKLGQKADKAVTEFLKEAYKDNRLHSAYELAKRGKGPLQVAVDSKRMQDVLRTPWSGKNYSERIWKNSDKLAKTIQDTIVNGVHRGVSVTTLAKEVQTRMGVGKSDAVRLVRTELNYIHNQATLDSLREAKMGYFQFIATLDKRTSSICRNHDNNVYPLDEAEVGSNVPPLHPRCRSTIAGALGPKKGTSGSRTVKIETNQKGERVTYTKVPRNMTYEDWKAVYVDKSKTFDEWKYERKIENVVKNDIIIQKKEPQLYKFENIEQAMNKMQEKYQISLDKKQQKRLNDELMTRNIEHIFNMDEVFKVINGFTHKGIELDGRKKAAAYVRTSRRYDSMILGINPKYFKDPIDELADTIRFNQKIGHFMPCDEDKRHLYLLTHEYGHIVHNDWIRKQGRVWSNLGELINGLPEEIDLLFKEQAKVDGITVAEVKTKYISKYGLTNEKETFAELFAHVMLSKTPNAMGKRFIQWLRRNGYDFT